MPGKRPPGGGLELDTIAEEVVDIEPPDTPERNYRVHTHSGTRFEARYIYLALGHLNRAKSEDYQFQDRYFHNPYPVTRLIEEIPRDAAVGVIGTRLSAIDIALGLAGAGHAGENHLRFPAAAGCPRSGRTRASTSSETSNAKT